MAETYIAGGRTAATLATLDHAVAVLWNPSTTRSLGVIQLEFSVTTAGVANAVIQRTTARGTAGSTVTADIDNAFSRVAAPPSGALFDLAAFSVQPTLDASELARWATAAVIGAGRIWTWPEPITVPAGAGLGLLTATAVIFPASDVTVMWRE